MIPHSLHNKEYIWSYDEKYDIFSFIYQIDKNGYLFLPSKSSFLQCTYKDE